MLVQTVISTSAARQKCCLSCSKGKSILTCSLAFPMWNNRLIITPTDLDSLQSNISPRHKMTFSPGLSESGQNKGKMITAMIQPFQTKLSPSGECQHKIQTLLFPLCLSPLFFHLHNPCDTLINNFSVICISMPEIEDRHSRSKYSPARNNCRMWYWWDEGSPGREMEYS